MNKLPDCGAFASTSGLSGRNDVMTSVRKSSPQKQGMVGDGTGVGAKPMRLPSGANWFSRPADTPALQ